MRGLILAAGLGERLRPYTLKRAKPAIEFLNLPMLAFPYYWLDTVDLHDITFNTHYLPETVKAAAMHSVRASTRLHFTHEEAILGSGGGIWNARYHLQGETDFAVANGDGVVLFEEHDTIEQMLKYHRRTGALATMLVCPLEGVGTKIPGVWQDRYGEVVNFGKSPARGDLVCLHYASYMFISKRIWDYIPEGPSNILYDVFMNAIGQGEKVHGFRVDKMRWFETGSAADYLAATRECLGFLKGGAYQSGLRRILSHFRDGDFQHNDLTQMKLISRTATIGEKAALTGFSVIGAGAEIGDHARLHDCVVLPGARVDANSEHKNELLL